MFEMRGSRACSVSGTGEPARNRSGSNRRCDRHWRRVVRIRHVVGMFAVALTSASCSLGGTEDAGSMNVYLSVDKATLFVNDTMTITVTARNVGFDPVSLTGPSGCLLYVDVIDNLGNVHWSSNIGCGSQVVTEELLAGVDKVQSFRWDGTNLAGGRLASGFYHVRGVARMTAGAYIGPPLSVTVE